MTGPALERVERALRTHGSRTNSAPGMWTCPAHEDRRPSLSVNQGERGAVLYCHAGCRIEQVLTALELEESDLFDEPRPNGRDHIAVRSVSPPRRVAEYLYTDRHAEPIARKVRFEPKVFQWEVSDGGGGWRMARKGEGNPGVLYNLPLIVESEHVHVGEGEKAADALTKAGHVATCAPTPKWTAELVEPLRGKRITLWMDFDKEGRAKAETAIRSLRLVAALLRVVRSRTTGEKDDAFDHMEAGYTVEQAIELDPTTLEPIADRPRLLTAAEYETDLAPEAIVGGLLFASSTTLLAGASKAGKTWLVFQLIACVVAGLPFLGLGTRAAVVLLCSLELSAGMIRERMRALARDAGIDSPKVGERFHVLAPTADYVPMLNLATETGIAHLRSLISETRAEVVVLDTLYRFLPGCDPNDNGEMGAVFGRLNALAQETGAAVLIIDHMAKGEHLGPVSHSALGASVKGGSARVVANLKRTQREDGGRWELNVESHFGSWEQPIHYERPRVSDEDGHERRGAGCVHCTASEAQGLSEGMVRQLFVERGERDALGRPVIPSKRKLREALQAAGLASGSNGQADLMVGAIVRDYCAPEAARWGDDRPIRTKTGPRDALIFTWRMAEPEPAEVL